MIILKKTELYIMIVTHIVQTVFLVHIYLKVFYVKLVMLKANIRITKVLCGKA